MFLFAILYTEDVAFDKKCKWIGKNDGTTEREGANDDGKFTVHSQYADH